MMKILMGGSPCTHWSIAQTKNRETEPQGIGWELFKNYLIAREKFKPDFFLYENNKSMAPAIRTQITRELGVEPILINSALLSAQNRQRLYWVGKRNPDGTYSTLPVDQPEDRGILLQDILESGVCWREKAYTLDSNYWKTLGRSGFETQSGRRKMVAEPVGVTADGKAYCLRAQYAKSSVVNALDGGHFPTPMAAEPIPLNMTADGKAQCLRASCHKDGVRNMVGNAVDRRTCVAEPVRIGTIESTAKNADFDSQQYRVYSPDGKSVTLCGQGGGVGAKTGLYAVPCGCDVVVTESSIRCQRRDRKHSTVQGSHVNYEDGKSQTLSPSHITQIISPCPGCFVSDKPIYEVRDGQITINGKQYPIKLADGFYIIRKLTVTECKRLQTVPDDYIFPVSDTQAYKMLGNGWTVDVIAHIMDHIPGIRISPVEVLSMYDGMSCGHLALDKLGAYVRAYYATEIDKYAIKTTQHNFPDTIQLGDAFQVRDDEWSLCGRREKSSFNGE